LIVSQDDVDETPKKVKEKEKERKGKEKRKSRCVCMHWRYWVPVLFHFSFFIFHWLFRTWLHSRTVIVVHDDIVWDYIHVKSLRGIIRYLNHVSTERPNFLQLASRD